tara:strand:+ start:219 stop:578 length:360 start_codon:yes stop_codon:yes gene_type:complete
MADLCADLREAPNPDQPSSRTRRDGPLGLSKLWGSFRRQRPSPGHPHPPPSLRGAQRRGNPERLAAIISACRTGLPRYARNDAPFVSSEVETQASWLPFVLSLSKDTYRREAWFDKART